VRAVRRKKRIDSQEEIHLKDWNISFIIAAYNEEKYIENRIINLINLDYPRQNIEIIVVSDGSTDRTNEIVRRIAKENDRVILLDFPQQRGRAFVHNEAVKKAKGNIIVFTDAETEFEKDFLKVVLPHFSDPKVGCVAGRIYYKNKRDSSITESAGIYWRYEDLIRRLESELGILAFGSGAALAVRKELFKPLSLAEDIDRVTPLEVRMAGFRVEYEPKAIAYDYIEEDVKSAHKTRVRKTSRAFKDILRRFVKINLFKDPLFLISVFFHKISRHLTPFYMIGIFILNIFLLNYGRLYTVIFFFQILFYIFAFLGWVLDRMKKKFILFYLPYNFVLINIGRFVGVVKSIFGQETASYN